MSALIELTKQEAFDKAAVHLLTQMQKSVRINDADLKECMYRGPGDLKCAVGVLIPDSLYESGMEQHILGLQRKYRLFPETLIPLLVDLQRIHDRFPVCDWAERLKRSGKQYNLLTKAIDDLEGAEQ